MGSAPAPSWLRARAEEPGAAAWDCSAGLARSEAFQGREARVPPESALETPGASQGLSSDGKATCKVQKSNECDPELQS